MFALELNSGGEREGGPYQREYLGKGKTTFIFSCGKEKMMKNSHAVIDLSSSEILSGVIEALFITNNSALKKSCFLGEVN